MVSKKTVIIILGSIFVLIVGAGIASTYLAGSRSKGQTNTNTPSLRADELTLVFSADPSVVSVGDTTRLDVRVSPQTPAVTVATIELTYDPSLIDVVQINEGTLWNQQTLLEKVVDNVNGVARITVGQGFDGKPNVDNLITFFTLKAKSAGSVAFSLGPKTLLARVGHTGALPVHAEPFALTIR